MRTEAEVPEGRPIRRRRNPGSARAPRLTDVAEHAGVSLATASRVLNGSSRVVEPSLAARVLASAKILRYAVNTNAQATARGTTRTVAIMVGDIDDAYFSAIASGVVRAADALGSTVSLSIAGFDRDHTINLLDTIRGQRPRALLVAPSRTVGDEHDEELVAAYAAIAAVGTRIAFIGPPLPGYAGVDVRNRAGAAQLAAELHDLGYRDFVILAGPPDLVTATERAEGFRDRSALLGTRIPDRRVVHGAFTRNGGYDTMNRLLDEGAQPDAVFAVTDAMAIGAMLALREHGIEPGLETAVAGFDDIPLAQHVTPHLTTVRLPLQEIGRRVLDLALAEGVSPSEPVDGLVILRDSTPPLTT